MDSSVGTVGGGLLNNFGLLQGTGGILAPLFNNFGAEVRVTATDTLRCEGFDNGNAGLINLLGGVADFTGALENYAPSGRITGRGTLNTTFLTNQGSILLSAGVSDFHGPIQNTVGAKVIVSGNATASFYDDVTNDEGSEFRVSTNSTAVFFGTVSGLGHFTGPGMKDFEGDTLPGPIATAGSTLVGPIANVVAEHVRESSLTVEGVLDIVANGSATGVSRVGALDVDGGKIDLTNNALVVDYTASSPISTIRSLIISGRAAGSWSGDGITSSLADAGSFAIGYAEATSINVSDFLGQTVDESTVLIRYTRYGDANLDGSVNTADFTALAQHFGGGPKIWSDGDFNYDGVVNALDFNALATNFGQVLPASAPELGRVIPEPICIVGTPAILMLLRRRRGGKGKGRD
jgi:hypothetical protein